MERITTKSQMYGLLQSGAFGNMVRSWPNLTAYENDSFDGLVNLRYKVPGSAWMQYGLTRIEVQRQVEEWCKAGAQRDLFTLNELCDDSRLILQGEVMRSAGFLSLRYSSLPMPMRKALHAGQQHADGVLANVLLRSTLDDPSYEQLWMLLDTYPDSIVEFSTWEMPVGDYGWNTVFWEVRHY